MIGECTGTNISNGAASNTPLPSNFTNLMHPMNDPMYQQYYQMGMYYGQPRQQFSGNYVFLNIYSASESKLAKH